MYKRQLLDNENATSKEIDLAIGDIIDAQEQLDIPRDGFSVLQAESSDATSGGSLRVEGSVPVSYTHLDVYKRQI